MTKNVGGNEINRQARDGRRTGVAERAAAERAAEVGASPSGGDSAERPRGRAASGERLDGKRRAEVAERIKERRKGASTPSAAEVPVVVAPVVVAPTAVSHGSAPPLNHRCTGTCERREVYILSDREGGALG